MTSNILSRLLPSTSDDGDPLIHHRPSLDIEDGADIDNFNMDHRFEDQDLERLLAEGLEDDIPAQGTIRLPEDNKDISRPAGNVPPSRATPSARNPPPQRAPRRIVDDDDDVPESLLLDGKPERRRRRKSKTARLLDDHTTPAPGPETQNTRAQWEATRAQQRLHGDFAPPPPVQPGAQRGIIRTPFIVDPKERATYMWANVDNLDKFLGEVYLYYEKHGIWSILLQTGIRMITAIFVFCLTTFVMYCVDYSKLPGSSKLEDVRVAKCTQNLPGYWKAGIWMSAVVLFVYILSLPQRVRELWTMHNFYHHLLDIPDRDIQTVSWQYVVSRLMALRDGNPTTATNISAANRRFIQSQSKQRMDAHDIANRLMRRDNYWIAMINKDILDCSLNIPFLGKRSFYSRVLQWNISLCLMDFVFDENGQVRPQFRDTRHRREVIKVLKSRFRTAGMINMVFVLPLVMWAVGYRFLTSFTEYQKNPSQLSARKFSSLAEWKIRDFNEVAHLFHRRKRMAYPYANRYLDQFPKDKMNQAFRFGAFIPGALAAILGVITMWDPDLFLGFEIGGRTALFWLGILGTIFVACRNAASDEDDEVWDPEFAMKSVIGYTHYCPESWQGKLHSDEVRREFSALYQLEALLFLDDIAGAMLTPFILMWSLPNCADQLIDFFREFTIHVDGLGTVCSFAVFDFKSGGKAAPRPGQRAGDLRDDYYGDKANKLMESYYSFLDHYGPNPKRGLQGRLNKRPFHPPPTFPGMNGSPSVLAENTSVIARHAPGPSLLRQSTVQTPRFGPAPGHISPMHSILLDPHHQPRSSPRQGPSSRPLRGAGIASSRHPLDADPIVAEEVEGATVPAGTARLSEQRTSSGLIDEDSELGDSWLLRGGVPLDEEAARRDANINGAGQGAGVLGMLFELQKAQKESRGGHI